MYKGDLIDKRVISFRQPMCVGQDTVASCEVREYLPVINCGINIQM